MSFDKIENKACLCAFIASMGDFASVFESALTSLIGLLQALKVLLSLVPMSLADQIKKAELEAALAVLTQTSGFIKAPLNMVVRYAEPWADCDPVKNLTSVVKNARDTVVKQIDDWEFELEQYKMALNDEGMKIAQIDRWIATLNDIKDAIDGCKNQ